uniref:Dephospho-CoA kinase n=1 Tax=Candidatus Kentrum sp. MB TaxID=2138164 RepID=A0A450X6L0_9GAMM|nr:MAG: dephospho-CoA kinase [Candidatus Kentron sp. MB]VFK30039.1 MAG: dephospho-CoA kinase [Candidatus Kentron sp. MB]VFK75027.1 MAG: dephospho-CoA kinase [Candidatus Kentron sp. MB]
MNTSRLTIALTGGIASGKTTVARILTEQGVPVIDADEVARELVEPGQPALTEIVSAFGTNVLDAEGRLDRAALRHRVFSVAQKRQRLEAILHPRITREMRRQTDAAVGPYCVLAIPLLVESSRSTAFAAEISAGVEASGIQDKADLAIKSVWRVARILVVDAEVAQQIRRACQRDGASKAAIQTIIRAQASREARLAVANDVITNNRDFAHLRQQTMMLHQRYLEMTGDYGKP